MKAENGKLKTYKLGELISLVDERNTDLKYGVYDVRGISIQKMFIETKADMQGVSLNPYLVVKPDYFAYVTVTSRNGEKITLAHNTTKDTYIVSSSYVVFYVKQPDLLNSDYLFMYFNRPEFDRFARFNSWGSARETFSWADLCDIPLTLPPLAVQEKYVAVYDALVQNQKSYERGLDDLKFACDAFLDKLKNENGKVKIGEYIEQSDLKNENGELKIESVRGISTEKEFIKTKADMNGVSLSSYKIVAPNEFVYVADTSRRGEKVALAFNNSDENYLVSSIYTVFRVKDESKLCPQYLMMFFERSKFDRYARFNSWGSARETFDWSELCEVQIPLPSLGVQKSIAGIYKVMGERRHINERLKAQIKDICPILIKGSPEEAI